MVGARGLTHGMYSAAMTEQPPQSWPVVVALVRAELWLRAWRVALRSTSALAGRIAAPVAPGRVATRWIAAVSALPGANALPWVWVPGHLVHGCMAFLKDWRMDVSSHNSVWMCARMPICMHAEAASCVSIDS